MTARPQVELPELPHPAGTTLIAGDSSVQQVYAYTAAQMHAYARQAIAEPEARAEGLLAAWDRICANSYDHHTPHMVCIPTKEWKAACAAIAQEAEREAGSA